jgi:hypothetical protein
MSLKEMIRSLKKLSQSQKLKLKSKSKSKRKSKRKSHRRNLDGFNDEIKYKQYGCSVPKSFI